ncbi:MAG: oxygen-independent coproporphyrinogen III oxidase [Epsilonproteobacteria bacterium]|nr:MAG: oxygen-independent coproporphyrinogen III oxidase [Campylobacterota bacterium]RLA67673.1 MAG: oxygen-independent coproporphyrinogen III oxidase [Campylobacterota bacterium]
MEDLLKKYNQQGPRYTSYPAVPFWKGPPDEKRWMDDLKEEKASTKGVDIYLHIPFCQSLCFYCGCHRKITKDKSQGREYVEYIKKEWDIYLKNLGDIKINSLHLGGGSPTFLDPGDLSTLLSFFRPYFAQDGFIGSIEVDPRACTDEHLFIAKNNGIERISLGIQDFEPKVQKAINRVQSFEMVGTLVQKIRQMKFQSLNFDLIYGLPNQDEASIAKTIKLVLLLSPDLIAYYSYAHVPWKIPNQKLINEENLPEGVEKRNLFEQGKRGLKDSNYIEVGFDHFARPDSYLGKAFTAGKLKRNFMGYTDKKSEVLIGLGVSSISNSRVIMIQNEKDIKKYYEALDEGKLPIINGHIRCQKDIIINDIIQDIMCSSKATFNSLEIDGGMQAGLEDLESDGLITYSKDNLEVTDLGHTFLRNVAMVFDQYLKRPDKKMFSRTV